MKITRTKLNQIIQEEYAKVAEEEGIDENVGDWFSFGKKKQADTKPEQKTDDSPPAAKKIARMLDDWEKMTWGGEREAQQQLTQLFSQLPRGDHRKKLVKQARQVASRTDLKESARWALLRVLREDHQDLANPELKTSAKLAIEESGCLDSLERAVMECVEHGMFSGAYISGSPDDGNYLAACAAVEDLIDEIMQRNQGPTIAVAQRR